MSNLCRTCKKSIPKRKPYLYQNKYYCSNECKGRKKKGSCYHNRGLVRELDSKLYCSKCREQVKQ